MRTEAACRHCRLLYNLAVSLVWMIPALGVSLLTVMVVLQLLDSDTGRSASKQSAAGRLIASAVGILMLLEGALVLFTSPGFSDATGVTTATHGIALVVAGVGIWGIAHRTLWTRISSNKH
jgi:hypothetical protein